MRSKALWGYDEEFMAACRSELTLGPSDLRETLLQVAEEGGAALGVPQIVVADSRA